MRSRCIFALLAIVLGVALLPPTLAAAESGAGSGSKWPRHSGEPRPTPSQAAQMAQSVMKQIAKCWAAPIVLRSVRDKPTIRIALTLDRRGRVSGEPTVRDFEGGDEATRKLLIESAKRAIIRCQPYKISRNFPKFYEMWKVVFVKFDLNSP